MAIKNKNKLKAYLSTDPEDFDDFWYNSYDAVKTKKVNKKKTPKKDEDNDDFISDGC
jgi:cephalosporin-C deacetylase-like acetyl esterase